MLCCSTYLEVTTDDEEVKIRYAPFSRAAFCFEIGVDGVETSMALAIDVKISLASFKETYVHLRNILTQPTTAIRGFRKLSFMSVEEMC